MIEALGDIPRQTLGLGGGLQIATGEIQPHAVAVDQALGLFHRQLAGRRIVAQRHHQFHFMMQFLGAGRVGNLVAVADHDGVGRLHEKVGWPRSALEAGAEAPISRAWSAKLRPTQ